MRAMDSLLVSFPSAGKDEVLTAPTSPIKERIDVLEIQIGNSTGADASVGWGYTVLDEDWKAGLWDDSAGASYIDDTTDAQDAGTNDFALGTNTTNNDGFVILSKVFPSAIRLNIGTAEAGSASTAEYTYWNGSAWTAYTRILSPDFTGTGDQYLVGLQPYDAQKLESGDTPVDTDGMPVGYYAVRVRFTTAAGTSAPLATDVSVVHLMDFIEKVGDGVAIVEEYNPGSKVVPSGCSLVPFCSAANSGNWIKIKFSKTP